LELLKVLIHMVVRRNFSWVGKVDFFILFRLLTMQYKRTFTKRFTFLHSKENALCYGNSRKQCASFEAMVLFTRISFHTIWNYVAYPY